MVKLVVKVHCLRRRWSKRAACTLSGPGTRPAGPLSGQSALLLHRANLAAKWSKRAAFTPGCFGHQMVKARCFYTKLLWPPSGQSTLLLHHAALATKWSKRAALTADCGPGDTGRRVGWAWRGPRGAPARWADRQVVKFDRQVVKFERRVIEFDRQVVTS